MAFANIQLIPGECVHNPTLNAGLGVDTEFQVLIVDDQQCPIDLTPYIEPQYDNPEGGPCSARTVPITQGILFTVRTHKCDLLPRIQKQAEIVGDPKDGVVSITFAPCDFAGPGLFLGELAMIADAIVCAVYKVYVELEASITWAASQSPITIAEVRLWVRDNCPEDNFLLDEVEYKDSEIIAAIRRAVDMWNEQPPLMSRFTYEYTNFPYRSAWLEVTIGFLKRIASEWYLRNHLAYQAGGVAIDDKNKFKEYRQDADTRLATYKQWMAQIKPQLNAGQAWGTTGIANLPMRGGYGRY